MQRVESEPCCGKIYKITNIINNKIYIGQTIQTLKYRFAQHVCKTGCKYLHAAILKYGKENFKIELIEEVPINELNEREIYWIQFYKSMNKQIGYNLIPGGSLGPRGNYKLSKEDVEKLKQLVSSNYSYSFIGKQFGINRKTVPMILKREGIYHKRYLKQFERTDLNKIKNFIFDNNPTAKEVCNKFKISRTTLFKFIKTFNYSFPTYRERQKQEYNLSKSVQIS